MNGINIYPAEIEQTLGSHPGVHDAVAILLKHEICQDILVCAVVLEKNTEVTADDLLAFARERLDASALYRIVILDDIPRNEQGKPVHAELNKIILAFLGRSTAFGRKGEMWPHTVSPPAGGRQLRVKINFSFIMPEEPDMVALDRWINGVLGNDLKTGYDDSFPGDRGVPAKVRQWLWRCLQLGRLLLQVGSVPFFDPPVIIACSSKSVDSNKWTAVAELVLIDDFPKDVYGAALQTSFSLAAWAMTHEPAGKNLEYFFKRVQERIVKPLLKVLPVGKSTYPVLREAHQIGIPFRHLGGGVFQLGWGANARRMDRSTTEKDSAMGAKLSHRKVLATRLLWSAGLPAAVHSVVKTYEKALEAARQIGWPVVIKPADRDRGEGVSVDVSDEQALKNAFKHALKVSQVRQVIVERQVPGVCHRLFVANSKLLYAVKRHPMSVTGDGKKSIEELVACEYELQQRKPPWKRTEIRPLDQRALDTIKAAGFSVLSVPEKGMLVPLRPIESTQWGGIDEEVTDRVHPENLVTALDAARLFSLHVAGVDIISTDISIPWYENGAIINEINYAPLFGGGEISKRHIPFFLRDFMAGDGRIPVNVLVGGDSALQASSRRWKALLSKGMRAFLTNERQTFDSSGKPVHMPFISLYRRIRALTLSPKVEAIVMAVQTDEFLYSGLPLEYVDSITVCDTQLASFREQNKPLSAENLAAMNHLLAGWKKV